MFRKITGWQCPGCGSSRALHHLLHFRFGKAIMVNPLLMVGTAYAFVLLWMQYLGGAKRWPRVHDAMTSRRAIWWIVGILVAYTVIRNVL